MCDVLETIRLQGLIPVAVIPDGADAAALARAIGRAGLSALEITLRTPGALDAIGSVAQGAPQMLVGAGTVTTPEAAEAAIDAGAKFVVSPGLNPEVVALCLKKGVTAIPGVSTPTEVEAATRLGVRAMKFFPAAQMGGPAMLRALQGPYPNARFFPTGGIGPDNFQEYLVLPNVIACGGSWMCPRALAEAGDFDGIEALCRRAVLDMLDFSLVHVGVNGADARDAQSVAQGFSGLFGLETRELPGAFFSGDMLEVTKAPFRDTHGHIAVGTRHIERAVAYFERTGRRLASESAVRGPGGLIAIYFEETLGGFAIHLRATA